MHRRAARLLFMLLWLGACVSDPAPPSEVPAPAEAGATPPGERPADPALLGPPRQLTFEGRRAGEGYFGPRGRRMVFQSEREPGNPFYQIYLLDRDTGAVERVSPGSGKTTCAWMHPDGERVVFASTHLDADASAKQEAELERRAAGTSRRYAWDYDEHYDLFVRDLESGTLERLTTETGYDAEASFSPDGRRIVFASNRDAYARAADGSLSPDDRRRLDEDPSWFVDLYVMDADGSNVRRLTRSPGYDGGPFFSPDGESIVWRRFSEDGARAEILRMPLAAAAEPGDAGREPPVTPPTQHTQLTQLTRLGAMSWAPYWHPSGDYLVFATNLHGFANFELYLVDARGEKQPVRVTEAEGFDGLPVFSPDGRELSWTRRGPGAGAAGSQIVIADWNGAAARRALGLPPADRAPAPTHSGAETAAPGAREAELRQRVEALASDEMEGRLTGAPGERKATRYVAEAFAALGLEPAGDEANGRPSWFQRFEFTAGVSLGDANQLVARAGDRARALEIDRDWRPLAFSRDGSVPPSEVVFVGYGVVAPADDDDSDAAQPVDDYAGLDVTNRWVLAFRYLPEDLPPERRQVLHRFASLRYKAMLARDRGARGILFVSGPRSRFERELVPLRFDGALSGTSLAVLSISDDAAQSLFEPSGQRLTNLQAALDRGDGASRGTLPGVQVAAQIELVRERRTGRNVVGRLPAPARAGAGGPARPVVVGAHVDHLGRGGGASSLADDDERGQIHAGADDNASGVAALIDVAEQLSRAVQRDDVALERDVVFAAWSGEELGLIGSNHFVDSLRAGGGTGAGAGHPSQPASPHASPHATAGAAGDGRAIPVAAYLNMDMVGRRDGDVMVYGVGSSSRWPREIERAAAPGDLALALRQTGLLPTDATPFALAGVPVLSVFTGAHAEYHTPRDTPDRLDYAGLAGIADFVARMAGSLSGSADEPDFLAVSPTGTGPPRAGLRVYLGTIPDYAAEGLEGLRLQGVIQGGPAQQAGLRGGDVIVEVGGSRVENIYDYTYALDALRVGEPVRFLVVREGRRLAFDVTPASRD